MSFIDRGLEIIAKYMAWKYLYFLRLNDMTDNDPNCVDEFQWSWHDLKSPIPKVI